MGSTRGSTLRNRRTVLLALILAAASAIAAILLTRAKETPHLRPSIAKGSGFIEACWKADPATFHLARR